MVIGGRTDNGRTADIEIVSPDPLVTPVPPCLTTMNPLPFGAMHNGRGAAIAPCKYFYKVTVTPSLRTWEKALL